MPENVFYSWQSDLPNSTNRSFILTALEKSAKELREDDSLSIEPVIDRDTLGLSGSPDIAESIFNKIDVADVFVSDVSLINQGTPKPTPNPNVLLELGYAIKVFGWSKIVMVMNTHYGDPIKLPFDLRSKRVLTYCVEEKAKQKAHERNNLERALTGAINLILENNIVITTNTNPPLIDDINTDKSLFKEFLEVLPSKGSIRFLDGNNMAGFSFQLSKLDDLREFYYEWNDAEHEFINSDLEGLRKKLHGFIDKYLGVIALETFPTSDSRFNTVPPEWEYQQPDRFKKVVNALHSLAGDIVNTHQELIRNGRRQLHV